MLNQAPNFAKTAAIAAVMSLGLTSLAKATPLSALQTTPTSRPFLVAEAMQSTLPPKAAMYSELIMMYMDMKKMGEKMMTSSDPEAKKMGEEMVKHSSDQLSKLSSMMRAEFLKNPDK
jgi:hypothetical protein